MFDTIDLESLLREFSIIVQCQPNPLSSFMAFYQRQRFFNLQSTHSMIFLSMLLPTPKENKTADTSKEIAYLTIAGCYITKLNIHESTNKLRLCTSALGTHYFWCKLLLRRLNDENWLSTKMFRSKISKFLQKAPFGGEGWDVFWVRFSAIQIDWLKWLQKNRRWTFPCTWIL